MPQDSLRVDLVKKAIAEYYQHPIATFSMTQRGLTDVESQLVGVIWCPYAEDFTDTAVDVAVRLMDLGFRIRGTSGGLCNSPFLHKKQKTYAVRVNT